MLKWLILLPLTAFSSLLVEADILAQKVCLEVAKTPPPSVEPQTAACLKSGSVWFSIDLAHIEAPAFDTLAHVAFWDILRDIGVQGVYLQGLKAGGEYRTAMGLDPKWGTEWDAMSAMMRKKGLTLIGDSFGTATGLTPDFALALKNVEGYRGLYHLIEIDPKDGSKLPNVQKGFANVPWLTLQTLHKKGYVPEQFSPYVKESSWNATPPIRGVDGKERRWIYLKENQNDPVMNWLGPSCAAGRIATGDLLDSMLHLGQKIEIFHGAAAQESLLLWARKLGGFSVFETDGGLSEWLSNGADLWVDHFTRPALLHALIAQDTEALKLIYRVFLDMKIPINRLVHMLQPYNHFACDYAMLSSKKQFQYYEEILTGDALKLRLLKEDAARLQGKDPVTWPTLCMQSGAARDEVCQAHLLLALFYAMQPGVFSFSVSDVLGLTVNETINPLTPNACSLYGSLPSQMKNSCSFARRLQQIVKTRIQSNIDEAELIAVPCTQQKGLLLLIHRLKNGTLQLLAANFSAREAQERLDLAPIRQTSAINLMTGLIEKKSLDASMFQLIVPPLSGKVILFQPKYFD